MAEALVVTRFLHFAALMAAFGIAAFRLYAFAGDRGSGHSVARAVFDERLRQAILLSAVESGGLRVVLSASALAKDP